MRRWQSLRPRVRRSGSIPPLSPNSSWGRSRPGLIFPYPLQSESDKKTGDEFLAKLEKFLREHLDPDEVDRTHEIPVEVIKGLADLGCFGMKIPTSYGGVGLSPANYKRSV